MADAPKITFFEDTLGNKGAHGPGVPGWSLINGLPLTVSPAASDLLAAVHFGFSQAVEMFRVVTQPPPSPQMTVMPDMGGAEDEEPATGILDMSSLWRLDPVAREAILSRHGLQTYREAPAEPDLTAEIMAQTIKEGESKEE